MACEGGLACLSTSGCVEAVPGGTLGQILTQGASSPVWTDGDIHPAASADGTSNAALTVNASSQVIKLDLTVAGSYGGGPVGTPLATVTDVESALDTLALCCHDPVTLAAGSNPALTLTDQVLTLGLGNNGSYTNTTSGLASTSVQGAIDELALCCHPAATVDPATSPSLVIDPATQIASFDAARMPAAAACALPLTYLGGDNIRYNLEDMRPHQYFGQTNAGAYFGGLTDPLLPNNTPATVAVSGQLAIQNASCRVGLVRFSYLCQASAAFATPNSAVFTMRHNVDGGAFVETSAVGIEPTWVPDGSNETNVYYKMYHEEYIFVPAGATITMGVEWTFSRSNIVNPGAFYTAIVKDCIINGLIIAM